MKWPTVPMARSAPRSMKSILQNLPSWGVPVVSSARPVPVAKKLQSLSQKLAERVRTSRSAHANETGDEGKQG